MGLLTSMYSGVSGLTVHGTALSSVADNIANLNTYAYKSTRVNFGDVMTQSLNAGGSLTARVGSGARILSVQNVFTQGSFETTDLSTDLAINGSGYFEVSNPDTDNSGGFFTRAGQFTLDEEGYLVTPQGYRLLGYNADAETEALSLILEDIQILTQQVDAVATTSVDITVNLDAEEEDTHHPSEAVDPSNEDTYNYLSTVRVYDSLGVAHDLLLYYQKLDRDTYTTPIPTDPDDPTAVVTNQWKVTVLENVDGTPTESNFTDSINTFYMHFDSEGHLVGTTTGLQAYPDAFETVDTFAAGLATTVSNRVGETFSYDTTPEDSTTGEQTFISKLQVNLSGWDSSSDYFGVGGETYLYSNFGTTSELVNAINSNSDTTGVWATYSGSTITLYGNGDSPSAISYSTSVSVTTVGATLSDLVDSINNGATATGMIYLSGSSVGGSGVTLWVGSTALTFGSNTTLGDILTSINALGTFTATTMGDNCIIIQATAVGSAGNATLLSSSASQLSTNAGDSLFGGMTSGSLTSVSASLDATDNTLVITRTFSSSSATLEVDSGNNLGTAMSGIDLTSFEQISYASDTELPGDDQVETDGVRNLSFSWQDDTGSTEPQVITIDFEPSDSSASTQSAGDSETLYLSQDGSPRGALQTLDIADDGTITGQFSNGTIKVLGAVVLVTFANENELVRQGENLWVSSLESGEPVYNLPGSGGTGSLESGVLEMSNVDLADEMVKLINYQRAYQANSKTISTTDTMLQELINLKR